MMDAHEARNGAFGARMQDPAFAAALEGYLAILAQRARAVRPVERRFVVLPPGERVPASPPRQKTAG